MRRRPFLSLIAILALLLAACGGGASAAPGSSSSTANDTSSSSSDGSSSDAEPTDSAAQPSENDNTGSSGNFTGKACDLLTAAEVEAASGQTGVVPSATAAGDFEGQSQCGYVANGVIPVAIVTVLNADTDADPAALLLLPGSKKLDVSGADAVWVPASGFTAFVIKHGLIATVTAAGPAGDKDPAVMAAALVQPMANRMP